MSDLENKKILLIITGGIACYKSLDLIRLLIKNKVNVKVVLTKSGKKFVTPLSISSLLKKKVFEDIFDNFLGGIFSCWWRPALQAGIHARPRA